ncbi:hypothetical protein KUTeg_018949 [Tegillarca granosa]|uniref:BTB domain-containing protein n=1 Tax=Tegillarca granosa TaxID=220873 RepID=A0ABQ9EB34_TEGGR|nr:hypothetical protein KUTeg_018949 [Tegillarca granosa]
MEPNEQQKPDSGQRLKFLDTLTSGLDVMLNTGQHADVTIVVEDKSFKCHKVILSSMSPYFEAMFSHDMKETRDGIVTLHDIDAVTFSDLVTFIYTGKEVVCEENAEKIFRAASLLQIPCLQERCEDFLLTQVSYDNCIGIWKIAKAHNCKKLAEKAFNTIVENFQLVSMTDEFESLDADEIVCVIKSDDLNMPTEEFVCDVAMNWIEGDESRYEHIGVILEGLRLPLVSSDYLFHTFESNRHIQNNHDCKVVVQEALKYHTCPAKKMDFTSIRTTQRNHSNLDDTLIVVGGLLTTTPRYQTTKEVLSYSFQQKKWYYLPSLPYDPGYEFAVCTHGDSLYVSGGWLKLQGMAEYKTHKNKWKVCASMTNGRCGHVMVAVANCIYVLGGRDGRAPAMTNIEEFSLMTKKWSNAGDLPLGVRSTSASAIGEKIYVFGGITESDKDTMAVQCFDTRLHTVSHIANLPFSCRLTRTVTLDTTVYVIVPDGRVIEFIDPTMNKASSPTLNKSFTSSSPRLRCDSCESDGSIPEEASVPVPVMGRIHCRLQSFSQHHFEVIQHRGQMLLVGGKTPDNTILKNIMEACVDVTDKLQVGFAMPAARWCFGCVKAVIRKDYLNNQILF